MKKALTMVLLFIPFISFADQAQEIKIQMLDSEIESLTKKRDSKYEELLKCEKSTKGFKIAGITTLIATGVGVYGNVKLSQKLNGKTGGGGGKSARVVIKKTPEEKQADNCEMLCSVGVAPDECGC